MKPETAVRLVSEYSALVKAIKICKEGIGQHLDLCNGQHGWRREMQTVDAGFGCGKVEIYSDRSATDQDIHLKYWYQAERSDYDGNKDYISIGKEQKEECPHCYEAHLIVQKRKALRQRLAHVKGSMTRFG